MAATMAEIAKRAKVSAATVSRVFSQNGYVSEETRERVLALASELGYSPRHTANTSVSMGEMKKIGLVIPDIRNAYYAELIHGIESFLRPFGFTPLVCSTDEEPEKELAYLEVLQKVAPAAVALVPTMRISEQSIRLLHRLERSGTPVVLLDRDIRTAHMDGVFMDNYSGIYQSVQAFISNGHKNIALIGGPSASSGNASRLQGYSDALCDNDIPIQSDYIRNGEFRFDRAYEEFRRLLAVHPEITAVLSTSRRMTSGCIFAMAELGLSIGKDIALICCGRPDINSEHISHVVHPTEEMGMECGKLLLGKMEFGSKKNASRKRIFVDTKLNLLGSEIYPTNK